MTHILNRSDRRRQAIMFRASSNPRCLDDRTTCGFTLVEMMVAVALVLLMMSMFASFFQMATGAMSQQKAIAENDQRERTLANVLRGDLDKRTFRDVFPFRSNEDTRQLPRSLPRRKGYFEIDEGDPLNDTDDVLQFTVVIYNTLKNKDTSPYTGKSANLTAATSIVNIVGVGASSAITVAGNFPVPTGSAIWISGSTGNDGRYLVSNATVSGGTTKLIFDTSTYLMLNNAAPIQLGNVYLEANEPDIDDGVYGNGDSISSAAEICYFLRNGILYRRVLLIRDPAIDGDAQPTFVANSQPMLYYKTGGGAAFENYPYGSPAASPSTTFWRDFDYSAFYFNGKNGSLSPGIRFHNASDSLSNSRDAQQILVSNSFSFPFSLGIPALRFGHGTAYGAYSGMPQGTYSVVTRFNMQECANVNFGYPGYMPSVGGTTISPFDRPTQAVDPVLGLSMDQATGLVSQYETDPFTSPPPRRGEDILMANVLTFDVKVWDSFDGAFVDIGDNTFFPNGPFGANPSTITKGGKVIAGRLNPAYGNSFDTWHPLAATGNGEPPYMPFATGANGQVLPSVLSAIQITINFRDLSTGQVRQTTIIQSLLDDIKLPPSTVEPPEE